MSSSSAPTIPKTMLAWQKHAGKTEPIRVQVPVPSAPDDGLLVKIHAAGVCHSDLTILSLKDHRPQWFDSFTLGHEGCGEVVAVGTATTQNFQVGDMVCVLFNPGCGDRLSCPECSYGVPQLCIRSTAYGIGSNGSFAPYVAIRERAAARLPQGISAAVGAVATDAVLTSYQAVVRRAKVQKGQTVVLFGLGGLGFNALQIILDIGARVVVVDRRQEVLDEAVKFGVPSDDVVPVGTTNVTEWIAQKGLLVDTVMDFVGMGETFKSALECVRRGGTVVLVGLFELNLPLPSLVAVPKRLDILCSYGGDHSDLEASLNLIAKGVVKPQVVTGRMADFPTVLADLHSGKIKSRIVLIPEGLE